MGLLNSEKFAAKLIERFTILELMQMVIESLDNGEDVEPLVSVFVSVLRSVYEAAGIDVNQTLRDLPEETRVRLENCEEEMRQFASATAELLKALGV